MPNNTFPLISNNFSLVSTSTFAYLSNNFVLIATTNQQLNNLLLPTCSLFQPICHLFCVPFSNSFVQPYSLNFSTFATMNLRNFAANFTFFCNFLSTSNHSSHFFNNQPFNQIFSFQFSHFIFLFSIDPPWIFLVRLAIFMPSLQGEPCRGSSHPSSG